jgi:hypothetical protein
MTVNLLEERRARKVHLASAQTMSQQPKLGIAVLRKTTYGLHAISQPDQDQPPHSMTPPAWQRKSLRLRAAGP